MGKLYSKIEMLLQENDALRYEIEEHQRTLASRVLELGFCCKSDYSFGVEWELQKYLRSFGFCADVIAEDRLLDSLIRFLALISDIALEKAIVFIHLKAFLSTEELVILYDQAVFYGLRILLLESSLDTRHFDKETKMTIDQHFLEIS